MSFVTKTGEFLISAAKLLSADVSPRSTAIVLAASRPDKAKFVAPTSKVEPSAVLGVNASVWFNSRVGAGSKVGNGACIMDGAVVEENCTLGDMCIIKAGAVVKKGSTIGARAIVGFGAVVPERSTVKDSTVLADGWNGTTVTESNVNPTIAEDEALLFFEQASHQQTAWSRTLEERNAALDELISSQKNPVAGEKWDDFVYVNPNPNNHPERRGIVFDK